MLGREGDLFIAVFSLGGTGSAPNFRMLGREGDLFIAVFSLGGTVSAPHFRMLGKQGDLFNGDFSWGGTYNVPNFRMLGREGDLFKRLVVQGRERRERSMEISGERKTCSTPTCSREVLAETEIQGGGGGGGGGVETC